MTMSWLAELKATSTAKKAVSAGAAAGSLVPSSTRLAASASWVTIAQPRRRPRRPSGPGRRIWSISGAQTNFRL